MQHSPAPKTELDKAAFFIAEMSSAKTLDEFEEAWKSYLSRLERCFNKAQAHFKKSPKWDSWWGNYKRLRNDDELLSYLINARGAEEHSVEQIVEKHPGNVVINAADGDSVFIKEMNIDGFGRLSINSPQDLSVVFTPAKMALLPIKNRGRNYPVPKLHLGHPIDPADVCGISKLAHAFYAEFLVAAEKYFVK
ncbi:hypothetical protein [Pseudomonas pharyngis]|jgi:hypothetical protein|uniref:hypothetical protein n=1 Tax=Pseudomonas pharyngis TaxID=2892333 RepID=UPI003FD4BC5D